MKKQRQRRRPASTPKGGSPRKPRAAPRPERGGVSDGKPVAVGTGASPTTDARSSGVPLRRRWESRNRVLLIGLFAFAAIAFVTAITVGVMVDLKEHGRTRLEALVGVGPSHAQGAP